MSVPFNDMSALRYPLLCGLTCLVSVRVSGRWVMHSVGWTCSEAILAAVGWTATATAVGVTMTAAEMAVRAMTASATVTVPLCECFA